MFGFLPLPWEPIDSPPEWTTRWKISETDWHALVAAGRMLGWTAMVYILWKIIGAGGPPFHDEEDHPTPPRHRTYRGSALGPRRKRKRH